ncbi:zinc finger A20 and AN1 domain-containing stress-associated protein 9-like [Pyrus ussuriensis x Pyrus communis]|uniref:Zinc finger A20 and AN1 domain-containing stress-associated protein 9-like n=1 Tax=Pyrus ussuriensis x Pyrus communis TaxID=2448454 RepID=A0A5N5HMH7_9ROSA|nr:zinc finger A20 and AN1 domain-containing stress-associated protein 9-like [Pyrus ussuriensis x Pyrus communis]
MEPPMCASGCEFYGTVENKNMCSKCYKDHLKHETMNAASADVTPKEKLNLGSFISGISSSPYFRTSSDTSLVSEDHNFGNNNMGTSSVGVTKKNRCQSCSRKVGVLGFQCRCGGVFCGMHRYPEEHSCDVDLKQAGRDILAKKNPLCKGDKLEWRI